MRLLLDENFPADFAKLLTGHEVATIHSLGWSGGEQGRIVELFGQLEWDESLDHKAERNR